MLEVECLDVHRAKSCTLRGVSLAVGRGEVVAVVGPNGAGKSTLLASLCGVLRPTSGRVSFIGEDIGQLSTRQRVKRGLVLVPEGRRLFASLSVLDNLELGARPGTPGKAMRSGLARIFDLFPILETRQSQLAGTLSGGEQQMLAIGRGMMAEPSLLMLDEPSLGLSPSMVKEVFRTLSRLRDQGTSILVVEQNVKSVLTLCDHAYVIAVGGIVLEGSGKQLLSDEALLRAYFS